MFCVSRLFEEFLGGFTEFGLAWCGWCMENAEVRLAEPGQVGIAKVADLLLVFVDRRSPQQRRGRRRCGRQRVSPSPPRRRRRPRRRHRRHSTQQRRQSLAHGGLFG